MSSASEEDDYQDDTFEEDEPSLGTWKTIAFNDIVIGDRIGGGGVGIVYNGTYSDKSVALKTLFDPRVDEALKQEYMDELLIMSKLSHPNIVHLIGASLEPPNLCIVMELCECSLYELLHSQYNNSIINDQSILLSMAIETADAMAYLHGRTPSVIHRDLKTANLLIKDEFHIKLCDFGLVTTRITTAGTPSYMPPELLMGKSFSKAVDVYMFAIVLWELFSKEIPFHGYDVSDIKRKVVAGIRPEIPTIDCPKGVQECIAACWHQDPEKRPTFKDVIQDLKQVTVHSEIENANVEFGDALDGLM